MLGTSGKRNTFHPDHLQIESTFKQWLRRRGMFCDPWSWCKITYKSLLWCYYWRLKPKKDSKKRKSIQPVWLVEMLCLQLRDPFCCPFVFGHASHFMLWIWGLRPNCWQPRAQEQSQLTATGLREHVFHGICGQLWWLVSRYSFLLEDLWALQVHRDHWVNGCRGCYLVPWRLSLPQRCPKPAAALVGEAGEVVAIKD